MNVVTGLGSEAGAALADHPDVDHLSFTGSRLTGEHVMAASARQMRPVMLELGGKSPSVLLARGRPRRAHPDASYGWGIGSGAELSFGGIRRPAKDGRASRSSAALCAEGDTNALPNGSSGSAV